MINLILTLILMVIMSIALLCASDTCEKSLRYRTDDYDKDEYYRKKLAVNFYYIVAFIGFMWSVGELIIFIITI